MIPWAQSALLKVASHAGFALAGLAVGLLLVGRCQQAKFEGVKSGASVRLEDTRTAERIVYMPSPTCPDLPVLKPTRKQAERIAERFPLTGSDRPADRVGGPPAADRPAAGNGSARSAEPPEGLERERLAWKIVPPAPWGGEVLASRIPGWPVDLDFSANRAPVVRFPGAIRVETIYSRFDGVDGPEAWTGRVRADLLEIKGTVSVFAEAAWTRRDLPAGLADAINGLSDTPELQRQLLNELDPLTEPRYIAVGLSWKLR